MTQAHQMLGCINSKVDYNSQHGRITSDTWLVIEPCYTDFEGCDSIQLDINEDLAEVDIDRIPDLIDALGMAYQLATGEPLNA